MFIYKCLYLKSDLGHWFIGVTFPVLCRYFNHQSDPFLTVFLAPDLDICPDFSSKPNHFCYKVYFSFFNQPSNSFPKPNLLLSLPVH